MTKAKRRRLATLHVLADLSRDGWKKAEDYQPLEKELRELEAGEGK